ncbi:MAG TPA: helix-turn-helix transcriptional regulator [Gemmataceae bacterium]|nr:helix-turn-helix transcriptional regulator [Gemmataceae bacterium]
MKAMHRRPPIEWTPEDRARHKAIREQFKNCPSIDDLLASGEYTQPVLTGVYFALQSFVGKLKKAREAAGMSLEDIARVSGIGKAALSRLENGQQVNPTINTLGRYAHAVGRGLILDTLDVTADESKSVPRSTTKIRKRA